MWLSIYEVYVVTSFPVKDHIFQTVYKYNPIKTILTKSVDISHLVQQNTSQSVWFKEHTSLKVNTLSISYTVFSRVWT